ncbi:hypothetical protein D6833_09425, partial [Candidatus Parcubacteria bacterium]
ESASAVAIQSGTLDERLYVLQDGNWNVTAVCDATGTVQERYAYSAYGEPVFLSPTFTSRASSLFAWETLYAGYRRDTATRLFHVRHRALHVRLGIWIMRDLAEYFDGENLYANVRLNPIGFTDPLGLQVYGGSGAIPWQEIYRLLGLIAAGGGAAQGALAALRGFLASIPAAGWITIGVAVFLSWCVRRGWGNCRRSHLQCLRTANRRAFRDARWECPHGWIADPLTRNQVTTFRKCYHRFRGVLRNRCHREMVRCVVLCGAARFRPVRMVLPAGLDCQDLCRPPEVACNVKQQGAAVG